MTDLSQPAAAAQSQAVPNGIPLPLWLLAELTYRCPLHCAFCYNPIDYTDHSRELSTQQWLGVLREARALGAAQLGFSGGEPLVRDDLEVLVGEARKLGFYTNLITSGVGLTDKRLDDLQAAGLDHIQLSFQDSTQQLNDFLSSTRTFELKQRVAASIKRHGFPMVLNCVLHRYNLPHVDKIIDMALAMGAEYLELANTQYYGWAHQNEAQLMPTREQLDEAEAVVERYRRTHGERCKIFFVVPDYFERRPKRCMNGWGCGVSWRRPGRRGAALSRRAQSARSRAAERERHPAARDLVRERRVQPLSRPRLDEGALPQLRRKGTRPRRLSLPGVYADGRPGQCRSGLRQIADRTTPW